MSKKVKLNWNGMEDAQKLGIIECAMVDDDKSYGDYPDFKRKYNEGQLFFITPGKENEFENWLKDGIDTKITMVDEEYRTASPKLDQRVNEIYSSTI